MNWIKGLLVLAKFLKPTGDISKCGALHQEGIMDAEKIKSLSLLRQRGHALATSFQQPHMGSKYIDLQDMLILARNTIGNVKRSCCIKGDVLRSKRHLMNLSRRYGQSIQNDPKLSRDFLVQLWVADKKMKASREKRSRKAVKRENHVETVYYNQYSFQQPALKQPPLSQSATGVLEPASLEEACIAPLLARSNLLITRDIEWANLVFGFEQENRYVIVDVCHSQSPVGSIREQSNIIARQLLRSRRPFVAYIADAMGNELFRVRRPFWWINSSIYAEIDGKEVGVVHRRWHLWKRVYDLYLGNKQFAVVENPGFWNWTFTLKDIGGEVLAQIDRDWRGFGFEIFTDAGQYVIRFGNVDASANVGPAGVVDELDVIRPLTLSERAVAVALAVSLDNDYFSRHGGWGMPFVEVGE